MHNQKYVEEFSSALRNIHEQKQKGDLKINSKGIEYFNQNTWEKSCETIIGEL